MSQAMIIVQQILSLLKCSRRKTSVTCIGFKEASVLRANIDNTHGTLNETHSNESTDLDSDPAILSTSGSDTESSTSQGLPNVNPLVRGPSGLELPHSLKLRCGGQSSQRKNSASANARKSFDFETEPIDQNAVGKKNNALAERLREISTSGFDATSSLEEFLKRRLERERSGSVAKGPSRKRVEQDGPQYPRVANVTGENSLRANLQKIATIDAKRVFMVRKIRKLGLYSHETLNTYFSKFGVVDHVFVTHGIDKRIADPAVDSCPQIHPASSGFVVMRKVNDVANIFKEGLEHYVSGVCISVTAYEHKKPVDDTMVQRPSSQSSSVNAIKSPWRRIPTLTKDNTLRSNLQKLAEVDAKRIIKVKRISKLGFGSAQFLKTFFGQFGGVTDVLVSHTFQRSEAPRPGTIGFVVMDRAEDVIDVFQKGLEHVVYGTTISVSPYEHHAPENTLPVTKSPNTRHSMFGIGFPRRFATMLVHRREA